MFPWKFNFFIQSLQYGGFLVIVLILELAVAGSTYAYKDRLSDGFDKGLNQSMQNYGPGAVVKSADFDTMQSKVRFAVISRFLPKCTILILI